METKFQPFLLLFIIIMVSSCSNNENNEPLTECNYVGFKYYQGEQDQLGEMSKEYILIASDTINSDNSIISLVQSKGYLDQNYEFKITKYDHYKYKQVAVKLNFERNCQEITEIISDIKQNSIVDYVHYTMNTDDCTNLIFEQIGDKCVNSYSDVFYVKVNDPNNLNDLNSTLQETNTVLDHQNQFMPEWFTLRADKNSNGDALQMANYFHETNLFEHSEPQIIKIPVE